MLKLLTGIVSLVLLSLATHAQGTVIFNNRTRSGDAPIIYPDRLAPSDVKAQLMLVGEGGSLTPLFPITTFRPAAARYFINPVSPFIVQGVGIGQPATFRVRAWEGDTFENAVSRGLLHGESNDVFVPELGHPLGIPGSIPTPDLAGLQGFTLVPEPSAIALGLIGAIVLSHIRRTPLARGDEQES